MYILCNYIYIWIANSLRIKIRISVLKPRLKSLCRLESVWAVAFLWVRIRPFFWIQLIPTAQSCNFPQGSVYHLDNSTQNLGLLRLLMVQKSQTTTVWMVKKHPVNNGISCHINWLAGLCPSTGVPLIDAFFFKNHGRTEVRSISTLFSGA